MVGVWSVGPGPPGDCSLRGAPQDITVVCQAHGEVSGPEEGRVPARNVVLQLLLDIKTFRKISLKLMIYMRQQLFTKSLSC